MKNKTFFTTFSDDFAADHLTDFPGAVAKGD